MNPLDALEMTPGASFGEAGAASHRLVEPFGMQGRLDRFDALLGRLFKRG